MSKITLVLLKATTLMLLIKQRNLPIKKGMRKKMVKEKKGTITKMEIKIKINFKVIKNLNKMMKMNGIK